METFISLVLMWWLICAIGFVVIMPIVILVTLFRQPPRC